VIIGVIPFEIVWGGRLADKSQMFAFEIASVIINLFMLAVIAIRASLIKINIGKRFINIVLWLMSALFLLNTIGNLLSNNELEKLLFTPLTFMLLIFSFRLAIGKNNN
jgi:hypothetical protein